MDEDAKKRIAEFRFGVIHDLIGSRRLLRGQREGLLIGCLPVSGIFHIQAGATSAAPRYLTG